MSCLLKFSIFENIFNTGIGVGFIIGKIFTINTVDFDHDGKKDLILAGNIYHTRLKFGNYDANTGFVFKNNGKGNFNFLTSLGMKGDTRSSILVNDLLFFGINQQKLKVFSINKWFKEKSRHNRSAIYQRFIL